MLDRVEGGADRGILGALEHGPQGEVVAGAYEEVADVAGENAWTATVPYDVTIVPARLAD